jgi:hypothetical protein
MPWRDALMWSVIICGLGAVFVFGGLQQAINFPLSLTPIPALVSLVIVAAVTGGIAMLSRLRSSRANAPRAGEMEAIRSGLGAAAGVELNDMTIAHLVNGRRLVLASGKSIWVQHHKDVASFVMSKD